MNLALKIVYETHEATMMVLRALTGFVRRPFYIKETVQQMDLVGVGSLPIVMLAGFFIGAVLALQTAATLQAFGAQNYT
ncbi:MAG: ABC transporter permease, partial [Blastocatellia bacterium]